MYDKKLDEIISKDPSKKYLKELADRGIIVVSPNTEKYLNDPNQLPLKGFTGNKTISKQFIIDLMSHDDSFDKIKQLYENDLFAVVTMFVSEEGNFRYQCNIDRMLLVDLLKQIDINEVPQIRERYNQVMDYVSYDKYKEKTQNNNYEIVIDGKSYVIPVTLIYQFMDTSNEEFNDILSNAGDINGIPIDHFLYAVRRYYEDNEVTKKYFVNEELQNRLNEIKSSKIVDVQMINEYLNIDDLIIDKIKVDKELENHILSDISPDFNDLEKALYIYIKLCKTLTYDEEFYAINQKGPLAQKHKNIDNVANISLTNNRVVCYEFDALYSYFLHKLGINYKRFVGTRNAYGETGEQEFSNDFNSYSEGHTFLKFRSGKYLVKADSVTKILQGDLMQAKLNQPLDGLVCENVNEESRNEFTEALNKVYTYIASREAKLSQNEPGKKESFDDIVSQFVSITDKLKPVDIREKIEILINKVNATKMVGIDAYSYLLQLKKILFSEQEIKNNFRVSIIRNSKEDSAEALAIITTRLPNEMGKMVVNRYMYRPGEGLVPISKEELQANFDDDIMGYVGDDAPIIPGIKM